MPTKKPKQDWSGVDAACRLVDYGRKKQTEENEKEASEIVRRLKLSRLPSESAVKCANRHASRLNA